MIGIILGILGIQFVYKLKHQKKNNLKNTLMEIS